ncbi:hypothetical protein GQ85_25850, partial [Rhodococcus rhodochrous]
MTIDETTPADNGRNSKASRRASDRGNAPASRKGALVDKLLAGEPYALAFGGQGAPWLSSLEELSRDNGLEPVLTELVNEATALLAPVAHDLVVVRPSGFDPIAWMLEQEVADEDETPVSGPSESTLTSAAVSLPGVFLTQVAALRALANQGLDVTAQAPAAVIGHSQGVLAVAATEAAGAKDGQILAIAQLIG